MSHPPVPLPRPLPDGLIPFSSEASQAFNNKAIVNIEFSGPTYHVRCSHNNVTEWVFVQLKADHTVQDLFCGCEECSKSGYCVHMAIALMGIFNNTAIPLHLRFIRSPFYTLCRGHPGNITIKRDDSKLIVGPLECSGSIDEFEKIVFKKEEQTEENSIKFSNCTDEELRLWGEGNISERLSFELSPLTDLCKYIFTVSEQKDCLFEFGTEDPIPSTVTIRLQEFSCKTTIPADVQGFLDSLLFHQTNIKIEHFGGKNIQKIDFSSHTNRFSLTLSGDELDLSHALQIPDSSWLYIKNVGFVRKFSDEIQPSLNDLPFLLDIIEKRKQGHPNNLKNRDLDVGKALGFSDQEGTPYSTEPFLTDTSLKTFAEPKPDSSTCLSIQQIHYDISFNSPENLRITPYFRTPNDLTNAVAFGTWVWTENYGFIRLEPSQVPIQGIDVHWEQIPEFIENHTHFLCSQSGFFVYQNPPNRQLSYTVDRCGALTFTQEFSTYSNETTIEIENWIYVPGKGFYPKHTASPIPLDTPIPPHKVAACIRNNQSLLEQVPHFFSAVNPIKETALSLTFRKNTILGQPTYIWTTPNYAENAFIYGSFGYIDGLGFFPMPSSTHEQSLEFSIDFQEKDTWISFFLDRLPLLQKLCTCIIDPSLLPPAHLNLVCQNAQTHKDIDNIHVSNHFDASFCYQSESGVVTAHELLQLSLKMPRFAPTKAGLIDLSDPRFTWLSSLTTQPHNRPYQLKHYDFLKISAFDHIYFDESTTKPAQEALHRLIYGIPIIEADFSALRSPLRPYQHDGVRWLWNLYLCGLSGLLCDDMGVGKTHQALGLIASTAKLRAEKNEKPRFLIVCPTSLLWHWKDKVGLLLPHMQVCMYVGTGRSESNLTHDYDVLITTYGTWRNDVETLSKIHFEIAIFDELQIAKNHISQIWTALTKVSSRMRIGLTGTPIENSLRELKALFDLILPGYFPKENLFKNRIMQSRGFDFKSVIAAYAKPFVLRRRKQDVLQELPLKTENLLSVELLPEQRDFYRKVASRETTAILTMLENDPSIIPYMHIFALLSALKHICNHPATYAKDIENYEAYSSGKWEAFQELLEEAINSGQKVVVFSHSLLMLDIIELHLTKKGIHFAKIRGSTKNRGEQIDHFQNNPKCKVFVASLMAAGLGIDLTAASVVIHYDRWWNAARENQATDRVHRLGQIRGVMVYKLMTTKTIEERIDRIISDKSSLLEDVLSYDDHRIIKQLSRQELIELLKEIEDV